MRQCVWAMGWLGAEAGVSGACAEQKLASKLSFNQRRIKGQFDLLVTGGSTTLGCAG